MGLYFLQRCDNLYDLNELKNKHIKTLNQLYVREPLVGFAADEFDKKVKEKRMRIRGLYNGNSVRNGLYSVYKRVISRWYD